MSSKQQPEKPSPQKHDTTTASHSGPGPQPSPTQETISDQTKVDPLQLQGSGITEGADVDTEVQKKAGDPQRPPQEYVREDEPDLTQMAPWEKLPKEQQGRKGQEGQEDEEPEKIGGDDDLILLDEADKPVRALPPQDPAQPQKPISPFRITDPESKQLYERAGTDKDGRAVYRKSV